MEGAEIVELALGLPTKQVNLSSVKNPLGHLPALRLLAILMVNSCAVNLSNREVWEDLFHAHLVLIALSLLQLLLVLLLLFGRLLVWILDELDLLF